MPVRHFSLDESVAKRISALRLDVRAWRFLRQETNVRFGTKSNWRNCWSRWNGVLSAPSLCFIEKWDRKTVSINMCDILLGIWPGRTFRWVPHTRPHTHTHTWRNYSNSSSNKNQMKVAGVCASADKNRSWWAICVDWPCFELHAIISPRSMRRTTHRLPLSPYLVLAHSIYRFAFLQFSFFGLFWPTRTKYETFRQPTVESRHRPECAHQFLIKCSTFHVTASGLNRQR